MSCAVALQLPDARVHCMSKLFDLGRRSSETTKNTLNVNRTYLRKDRYNQVFNMFVLYEYDLLYIQLLLFENVEPVVKQ